MSTTNIYLILKEDYTFTACFASASPENNVACLTEEKTYPVIYCYSEPRGDNACRMVVCNNREELLFALNKSGRYYQTIHKLWEYDWKNSKNYLLRAWEEVRQWYFYEHIGDYMCSVTYQELAEKPDMLAYWANIRYPKLELTEEEAAALTVGYGNTLLLGVDGEIYIDDYGAMCQTDILELGEKAISDICYQIEENNGNVELCKERERIVRGVLYRLTGKCEYCDCVFEEYPIPF